MTAGRTKLAQQTQILNGSHIPRRWSDYLQSHYLMTVHSELNILSDVPSGYSQQFTPIADLKFPYVCISLDFKGS
jgi:hypothetical protein